MILLILIHYHYNLWLKVFPITINTTVFFFCQKELSRVLKNLLEHLRFIYGATKRIANSLIYAQSIRR